MLGCANRIKMTFSLAGILLLTACQDKSTAPTISEANGRLYVLESGGIEGDTGWWPSLVIDRHDVPHLSYCDAYNGDLKYATQINGKWTFEDVVTKGAVGKYTSIAIDDKGKIGISYYDQDKKYLRYASSSPRSKTSGRAWMTESIAWGLEVGMASELRFDEKSLPHLFYYIPSGKLIYAHKPSDEQSWLKRPIADATGSFSISIDSKLRKEGFWISYVNWTFRDTLLHVARPHQSAQKNEFKHELVAEKDGAGWRSRLFFENNEPRIIYSVNNKAEIRLAKPTSTGWESTLLIEQAANFSAAQNSKGQYIIAYEDIVGGGPGRGLVRYAIHTPSKNQNATELFSIGSAGPSGSYLDVAVNSKDQILIVYYSTEIRGLMVWDETPITK